MLLEQCSHLMRDTCKICIASPSSSFLFLEFQKREVINYFGLLVPILKKYSRIISAGHKADTRLIGDTAKR